MVVGVRYAETRNSKPHALWIQKNLYFTPDFLPDLHDMGSQIFIQINKMIYMDFRYNHSMAFSDRPMIEKSQNLFVFINFKRRSIASNNRAENAIAHDYITA